MMQVVWRPPSALQNHGACVMLTANLWVDMGLVNGEVGTVAAICYDSGGAPPHLPVAVMVQFDSYQGPHAT